jgi:hypothetical protein
MPVKWDEAALSALFMSVVVVACPTSMTDEQKDKIVAEMQGRGYDVNWNGIRYIMLLTCFVLRFARRVFSLRAF